MPDDAVTACMTEVRDRCPWIAPLWREHVENNDGLLPHVLMGRITSVLAGLSDSDLAAFVAFLERGLASTSPAVADVIGVSFIENLYGEDALLARVSSLAGPMLKTELAKGRFAPG